MSDWLEDFPESLKAKIKACGPKDGELIEMTPDEMRELTAGRKKIFINTPPQKTLRDEFAMAALTGLITRHLQDRPVLVESVVDDAYTFADAMLAQRRKK